MTPMRTYHFQQNINNLIIECLQKLSIKCTDIRAIVISSLTLFAYTLSMSLLT